MFFDKKKEIAVQISSKFIKFYLEKRWKIITTMTARITPKLIATYEIGLIISTSTSLITSTSLTTSRIFNIILTYLIKREL